MRITRKEHRLKFCEWYFENIKPKALASEILDYVLEHKCLGNNMGLSSTTLAVLMRGHPERFEGVESRPSGPLYWSLKRTEELS